MRIYIIRLCSLIITASFLSSCSFFEALVGTEYGIFMRNDTDKNQYCIDSEGNWFLYNKTYIRLLSKTDVNWHKATVKEIIGHLFQNHYQVGIQRIQN